MTIVSKFGAVSALLAATVSTVATTASAELWTLHSHKSWKVLYMDSNSGGQPMCVAEVQHKDGVTFYVKKARGDTGWFSLWDNNVNWGVQEGQLDMWVDNGEYVTIDAYANGDTAEIYADSLDGDALEFLLNGMGNGRNLYIDWNGNGKADYKIDLRGSKAALMAFGDCADKLQ